MSAGEQKQVQPRRRWLRWLGLTFLTLILLVAAGVAWLVSAPGQRWIMKTALTATEGTSAQVTVEGQAGSLFGATTFQRITVADQQGIWLDARNVQINWQWRALLKRDVLIDTLAAQSMALTRLPQGKDDEDSPDEEGLALPDLPVDLMIQSLAIDAIDIPRDLGQTSARFSLESALLWQRNGEFELELALRPEDAASDRINVDVAFNQADESLRAKLSTDIPEDGPLARLFQQRGRAIQAEVALEGTLARLGGPVDLSVSDLFRFDGDVVGDNSQVTLEGTLEVLYALPDSVRGFVDQPLDMALTVGRPSLDSQLTLSHARWSATLSKVIDPNDLTNPVGVRAEVQAEGSLLAPFTGPVGLSNVAGDAVLTGIDDELSGVINMRSRQITLPTGTLNDLVARIDMGREDGDVRVTADATAQPQANDPNVQDLLGDQLSLSGTVRSDAAFTRFRTDGLNLTIDTALLEVAGRIDRLSFDHDLEAKVIVGDLAAVLPDWGGSAYLEAESSGANLDRPWDITAQLDITNLKAPSPLLQDLASDSLEVRLSSVRQPDNTFDIEDLSVDSSALTFFAQGVARPAPSATINWRASIPSLDVFNANLPVDLAGGLDFAGQFDGNPEKWIANASSRLAQVDLPNTIVSDAILHLEGRGDGDLLDGSVRLAAASSLGDLLLDAGAQLDGGAEGTVTLNQLRLARLSITGDGSIAEGSLSRLDLSVQSLPQETLSLKGISGEIDGTISYRKLEDGPYVEAALYGSDALIPLSSGETIMIDGGVLQAQLQPDDYIISFSVIEAGSSQFALGRMAVGIYGPPEELAYDASIRGALDQPVDLLASGVFINPADGLRSLSGTISGDFGDVPVTTRTPFNWQETAEGLILEPFDVALGPGSVRGAATLDASGVNGQLTIDDAPLSLGRSLQADWPYQGSVNFSADLTQPNGDWLNGTIRLDTSVTSFGEDVRADLPYRIEADGIIAADVAQMLATVTSPSEKLVDVQMSAPISADLSQFRFRFDKTAPWYGIVRVDTPVAPVWSLTGLERQQLNGRLKMDVDLIGSREEPDLKGSVRLEKGLFIDDETGFELDQMTLSAEFTQQRLTLSSFSATDGADGTFDASGWVEVDQSEGFPAQLNLKTNKATLVRRADVRATASADLSFNRTAKRSQISGTLTVDRLDAQLTQVETSGIPDLPVTEINLPDEEARRAEQSQPVFIDLKVKAPQKLFVTGRGLDAEFAGDLRVTGRVKEPSVAGNISLVRGSFSFAGTRFDLTRGTLTFDGGSRIDPLLDIRATAESRDLTAFLAIDGPSSRPELSLSSSPALPQDEVLSRLLFGTSATELSALEAVELAAAVSTLSGGGGADPTGIAKRGLGLDRLGFSSGTENEGPTITGGKYLSNDVYLEVITATATGDTAARLEIDLTKNLSLLSRFGSDRENALSVQWSWDY